MKRLNDKAEIRDAVMRAAASAYPGTLEREDLEVEPAIARADGRTVEGALREMVGVGLLFPVEREIPSGKLVRMKATDPAALAVRAVT